MSGGGESTRSITFRALTKGGDWRYMEARAIDLRDDSTIAGVVVNTRDVTERVLDSDRLAHAARHDYLTQLPNRAYLLEHLTDALQRTQRSQQAILLCYLDMNDFKSINDDFGHATGDDVLVHAADRLRSSVRHGDIAARFGGDEFIVINERIHDMVDAEEFAGRLAEALSFEIEVDGRKVVSSVTVGFALSVLDDSTETLLGRADADLYQRKRDR